MGRPKPKPQTTMSLEGGRARWHDPACLSYMKNNLMSEEECSRTVHTEPASSSSSEYRGRMAAIHITRPSKQIEILRSLPYAIGDPLRREDKCLCCFEEVSSYALTKLRPGDCGFILRSDGSYTYALYEGPAEEGDPSSVTFRVDKAGSTKIVRRAQFGKLVKIPALVRPDLNLRSSLPNNARGKAGEGAPQPRRQRQGGGAPRPRQNTQRPRAA